MPERKADRTTAGTTGRTAPAVAPTIMTPSQVIEIRQLQPLVLRWLYRAAFGLVALLLAASVVALSASVWAALKEPAVWAVLPRGDVLSITPVRPNAAMEQQMRAQGVAR
jgi:hypothetical protein